MTAEIKENREFKIHVHIYIYVYTYMYAYVYTHIYTMKDCEEVDVGKRGWEVL